MSCTNKYMVWGVGACKRRIKSCYRNGGDQNEGVKGYYNKEPTIHTSGLACGRLHCK